MFFFSSRLCPYTATGLPGEAVVNVSFYLVPRFLGFQDPMGGWVGFWPGMQGSTGIIKLPGLHKNCEKCMSSKILLF